MRAPSAGTPPKPNGQPSRRLDTTRARELFGFEASTDFEAGLAETVNWYREQLDPGVSRAARP